MSDKVTVFIFGLIENLHTECSVNDGIWKVPQPSHHIKKVKKRKNSLEILK